VRLRTNDVKLQADELMSFVEETSRDQRHGLDEVYCALQWAQNSTAVFLGVKYASRWSAPGAIEVADVDVNISDSNFSLAAFGHHSSIRKRYVVDLPLFAAVVPESSSWSSASVGRATATLQKVTPAHWPKLFGAKTKHPITSWLDMEERWQEELRSFKAGRNPEKGSKASQEAPAAAAAATAKGQRIQISWQKKFQRQWKKLPKSVRKVAPWLLLAVGAFLTGYAIFILCTRDEKPVNSHEMPCKMEEVPD